MNFLFSQLRFFYSIGKSRENFFDILLVINDSISSEYIVMKLFYQKMQLKSYSFFNPLLKYPFRIFKQDYPILHFKILLLKSISNFHKII